MTKKRRRRKEGSGSIWEIMRIALPESVDEAGIGELIVIADPGSGMIVKQEFFSRPAHMDESRQFIEATFRKTMLRKRPREIRAIGDDIYEAREPLREILSGSRGARSSPPA